jgi:hypothetical protein
MIAAKLLIKGFGCGITKRQGALCLHRCRPVSTKTGALTGFGALPQDGGAIGKMERLHAAADTEPVAR